MEKEINKNINVVYEDNHILVVIKPQNVPTQSDASGDLDMLNIVKNYVKEKYNKPGNVYVGLVHRLDRPTGGLMVFAKTSKAASRLSEQIKSEDFSKKYLAVCVGNIKNKQNKLVNYLVKDEKLNIVSVCSQNEAGAKRAELNYKVIETKKDSKNTLNLVEVELLTGRSHQIRVQMAHIGNSLFGDVKYKGDIVKGYNLALWAYSLKFTHPTTKQQLSFVCLPPENDTPWKFFDLKKLETI